MVENIKKKEFSHNNIEEFNKKLLDNLFNSINDILEFNTYLGKYNLPIKVEHDEIVFSTKFASNLDKQYI